MSQDKGNNQRILSLVGSIIVAVAIIALVGSVGLAAILRYDADNALKIWGVLGTIVGLITGSIATFFFTRQNVETVKEQASAAKEEAKDNKAALTTTVAALTPEQWQGIRNDPPIRRILYNDPPPTSPRHVGEGGEPLPPAR